MTLAKTANAYFELSSATASNFRHSMQVRKAEFITEILLSAMVVYMTVILGGDPTMSAVVIGLIHSFNAARVFEAYKEAEKERLTR